MAEKKFESALRELEQIVDKLDDQDLPLEESIAMYEKGVKLSRICSKKLSEAQIKIEKLAGNLGNDQGE